MALIALNYPEVIIDNLLDFLVGPVDYYKSMFQWTLNELLDNQIGREAKAEQLYNILNNRSMNTLLNISRHDHIEYEGKGIYRTQLHTSFTTFTLKWNHTNFYGPDKIRIRKGTYYDPWMFCVVRYKVLTPEQIDQNRSLGITWTPAEFTYCLTVDDLLQDIHRVNELYQARIQL